MRTIQMLAAVAAVLALAGEAARANTILIDDFEAGSAAVVVDSSTSSDEDTDTGLGAHAIGGARTLGAVRFYNADPLEGDDQVAGAVGSGALSVSATLLETDAVVAPYANYGTARGGAELNSDWTGMTAVRISFADAPNNAVDLYAEVFWNGGNGFHLLCREPRFMPPFLIGSAHRG